MDATDADADTEMDAPIIARISQLGSARALARARRTLTNPDGENPFARVKRGLASQAQLKVNSAAMQAPPPAGAVAAAGKSSALRARVRRLAEFARERQAYKADRGGQGHSYWYSVLSSHSQRKEARVFRSFIAALILANIVAFVVQSDPYYNEKYQTFFGILEGCSSFVFLVEYLLRVYVAPEHKRYAALQPGVARWAWMRSWESIIDLLAFTPWFIEVFADTSCSIFSRLCGANMPNLMFLRTLRLFRILKSAPVMNSFDVVARVFYFNAEILCVSLIICLVLLLVTSTLLYYVQPNEAAEGLDDFSSVPATMYLSVMMLTGQGIPGGKLPLLTKGIVTLTAFLSVAQFAIPASMLAWGFEQEAERRVKKQYETRKKQVERIKRGLSADPISSSSSGESYASEWEEYEDVVCGSSSSSGSDGEKGKKKRSKTNASMDDDDEDFLSPQEQGRAARIFSALDRDESGFIKTHEMLVITDVKGGKSLMKILDKDGDGKTSSEEFFAWLQQVKKDSGDVIFSMLLRDLERIDANLSSSLGIPPGSFRCDQTAAVIQPGLSPADQLLAFADQYRKLQDEQRQLTDMLMQRDKIITDLRLNLLA